MTDDERGEILYFIEAKETKVEINYEGEPRSALK